MLAGAAPAPMDALAQKAAAGGRVVWYDTSAADGLDYIVAAFNRQFPAVRVRPVRLPDDSALAPRVIQESQGGRGTADVASGGAGQLMALAGQNLVLPVAWPELGVAPALVANELALRTAATLYVILWNSVAIRNENEPNDWSDLLDPRWRGRVGAWTDPDGFAQLASAWGEPQVTALVRGLLENRPVLAASSAELAAMVASGNIKIAFGVQHTAMPAVRRGAPIGVRFLDPTPVSTIYTFVPKHAANPAGGTLLAAWLATPEGAAAYESETGRGNPLIASTRIASMFGRHDVAEYPLAETATLQAVSGKLGALLKATG